MNKPSNNKSRVYPTRRNFSVKQQLVGKLGPKGYEQLLDQLGASSSETPTKRRRRRARKAMAA